MAAVGIFGVMSYSVSARTQELGVRMALGARPQDVVWLVLGSVLKLAGIGLAAGIALLLASRQALAGLLFGVTAADTTTIASVTVILGLVAVIAAWVPASRASRIDPIQALRYRVARCSRLVARCSWFVVRLTSGRKVTRLHSKPRATRPEPSHERRGASHE